MKAYTTSTDQTLIWGDPLSLDSAARPGSTATVPLDGPTDPEANECWAAAQALAPRRSCPPPASTTTASGPQRRPPATYEAPVPAAVHLHGGEVPAVLDGGPDSWWTPNGIYGHGYYSKGGIG